MDEYDNSGKVLHQVRQALKSKGLAFGFDKIVAKRSSSEPLIQVADLIAGAVNQAIGKGNSRLFNKIESKMVVAEFEG